MSGLVEVTRDLRVSRSGHAAAFDSDTSRWVTSAASWLAGSRSCRPRQSITSHVPRKSELFFTDDVGLAGAGAVDGFVVGGSASGHSPPSAWKLSSLTTDALTEAGGRNQTKKAPRIAAAGPPKSPPLGWRDFLRKRVSAVLQGPAMERQREKHPGRRLTSPRQWREFERFVGQPIEMAAGPGTDEQQRSDV